MPRNSIKMVEDDVVEEIIGGPSFGSSSSGFMEKGPSMVHCTQFIKYGAVTNYGVYECSESNEDFISSPLCSLPPILD